MRANPAGECSGFSVLSTFAQKKMCKARLLRPTSSSNARAAGVYSPYLDRIGEGVSARGRKPGQFEYVRTSASRAAWVESSRWMSLKRPWMLLPRSMFFSPAVMGDNR